MNRSGIKPIIVPTNEASFQDLCLYVGRIASVCVGKENVDELDAIKVGIKCLTDGALKTPSTPWQYVPITPIGVIATIWNNARGSLKEYDFYDKKDLYEFISESLNFKDFFAFQCRSIGMVFDHMVKHNDLSIVKESLRHLGENHKFEYEFPEFENKETLYFSDYHFYSDNNVITEESLAEEARHISPETFRSILRKVYNRLEMWNRHHSSFILVDYKLCGTKEQFENLFNERSRNTCKPDPDCNKCKKLHRSCAQLETRYFVQLIEDFIFNGKG